MALVDTLLEERGGLEIQARNLIELAESENRDFTAAEKTTFDSATDKLKSIDARCRRLESFANMNVPTTTRRSQPTPIEPQNVGMGLRDTDRDDGNSTWLDLRTGESIRSWSPTEKIAKRTTDEMGVHPYPLGRCLRSAICGQPEILGRELRSMTESVNWYGGSLVPDELAGFWFDRLRAETFVARLGATTVQMGSETMSIARVSEDPSVEIHGELETFTGTQTTLSNINLTAFSVGATITLSRELAQDAPNAEQIIEQTLSKALALQLDTWAMQGTGSGQPLGLINHAGVNEVSSVGAVVWDDFLTGLKEIYADDGTATAYVISPATWETLAKLKTGDGSTSAAMWLGPPTAVAELEQVVSTVMTDTDAVVGNFADFLIGMRQPPMVELTLTGGDHFAKHSVGIKITERLALSTIHPESFCKLTGIS